MIEPVWLNEDEAATLLDCSPRHLRRMKNTFAIRLIPSARQQGKMKTQYALSSLSLKAQRRHMEAHAAEAVRGAEGAGFKPALTSATADEQQAWFDALPAARKQRVAERLRIYTSYRHAVETLPPNAYGLKQELVAGVCAEFDISRGTLYRFVSAYESDGLRGLDDNRFGQKRTKLSDDMRNCIIAALARRPHTRVKRLCEQLEAGFGANISYPTVHRFVKAYKEKEHSLVTMLGNPDDWKNRYLPAFGDMDAKAHHFLHYIEMDSSPADVLCNDGKRYALVSAIDIFSRKLMIRVAPTSCSRAIADVLRDVLTKWGVPENIIKDNGQDYVSKYIHQILAAFAIHAPFVPHFTPEAKPHVERSFRTLAEGLLEELPGYIGHNVAQRKGIEARRSFADRIMKKGELLEIGMTPEELQVAINSWLENIYHQRKHSELGCSPEVKAAQSPKTPSRVMNLEALEIVLLPESLRKVGKKGIRIDGGVYACAELADMINDWVRVKVAAKDASKLYVYSAESRYLCVARDQAVAPMPVADIAAAKKRRLKEIREQVKAVKTLGELLPDYSAAVVGLKGVQRKITALVRANPASNEALTEAAKAAAGLTGLGRVHTIADGMVAAGLVPPDAQGDEDPLAWMGNNRLRVVNEE